MLRVNTSNGDSLSDMSKKDPIVIQWYEELLRGYPLSTPNHLVRAKQVKRQPQHRGKTEVMMVAHVETDDSYFAYQLEADGPSYSVKVAQKLDEFEGLAPV